jgi:L-2-amino-thiazoline-4-carboxylic acid hydrolase
MEQENTFAPEDFAGWFAHAVTDAAVHSLAHTPPDQARALITQAAAYLVDHNRDLVVDKAAEVHLSMCAVVLAAYRVVRSEMETQEAVAVMKGAMTEPFRGWLRDSVFQVFGQGPDPYSGIANTSKAKEVHLYGESFRFDRPSDDDNCYHLVVRTCFYNEFCRHNGAAELTQAWCAFDTGWMDVVNETDRGVAVDRPMTMGLGGDHCDFIIRRTSSNGPEVLQ